MFGALLGKSPSGACPQVMGKSSQPDHLAHWDGTYTTAYVDDASDGGEEDEGYWRGAWSETLETDNDTAGNCDNKCLDINVQWPTPEHWPCPATSVDRQHTRPCAARVCVLPGRGRAALATRELACGEEVGLEPAFAFVVRDAFAQRCCAHCASALSREVDINEGSRAAQGDRAFAFCTAQCEEAALASAPTYFEHVATLKPIAAECSVDVDLLRILLRLCCIPELHAAAQQYRDGTAPTAGDAGSQEAAMVRAHAVLALCTHEDKLHGSWVDAVEAAAIRLLELLPPALQMPAPELVLLGARVNANAYGVSDPSGTRMQGNVGFGLFPFAAMLNHSCEPNCAFTGASLGLGGAALTIRANRPIARGEELTFGYIDLYQDVVARRKELESTKYFVCECERCCSAAQDPQAGAAIVDRRLSGLLCPACASRGEVDGVMQPPGLLHDTVENHRLLVHMVRGTHVAQEVPFRQPAACSIT